MEVYQQEIEWVEQFGYAKESEIQNIKNNGTSVVAKSAYTEEVNYTATCVSTTLATFEYPSSSIGGICGKAENTNISTCSNSAIITGGVLDSFSIGGIVGDAQSNKTVKLSSCINTANISTQMECTAGIAGITYGYVDVENCTNNGIINSTYGNIGGIIGAQVGGSIKNCNNKSNITGEVYVGGIAGQMLNIETSSYSVVENCSNEKTATITSTGKILQYYYQQGNMNTHNLFYTGGIIGHGNNATVSKCSNFGKIVAQDTSESRIAGIGGISGEIRDSIITKCYNKGAIQYNSVSFCVGGIVGVAYYNSYINNCYNTEEILGNEHVGGIVGYGEQANIRYCYNKGSVKGNDSIGGIAGSLSPHDVNSYTNNYLYYCYNTGAITGNTKTGTIVGHVDYYDADYMYSIGTDTSQQYGYVGKYKNATNQKMYSDKNSIITAMLGHFSENFTSDYTGTASINDGYPILKWEKENSK